MAGNPLKTFDCPSCGGVVTLRAAGHSVSAVCEHCSTLIDTANDNFAIIKKFSDSNREIDIPIGSKGELNGIKWEVIGYVLRNDFACYACWDEYLLFNPYHGFRFLVEYEGHWNLARVIKRNLNVGSLDAGITIDQQEFSIYHRGKARVEYVKGEFYWRIRKGDVDDYADFICPPYQLSVEQNEQEINLSMAEYLPAKVVEQAFNITSPDKIGVAPNQPPPFHNQVSKMWGVTLAAFIIALAVQLFSNSGKLLDTTKLHLDAGNAEKNFSSVVFEVPHRSNISVKTEASDLKNNWLSLNLSLVNEATHQAFLANQGIEYYAGVDDGESWSEGSRDAETFFSGVEKGRYRLVIDPKMGNESPPATNSSFFGDASITLPNNTPSVDITVQTYHNVRVWSNFWFVVFCVLTLPIYVTCHRWYFEYRRWKNSDYSPGIYSFNSGEE